MKAKKEKIFDAVFDTVLETGCITNITVSEIAKRAGIGKGSVYMYFANKEQMMFESVQYFVESTMKKLVDYKVDESKGFKDIMHEFLTEHINVLNRYSKMFYSTFSTEFFPQLTPGLREMMVDVLADIRKKYQAKILKLIAIGANEGIVSGEHASFEILAVAQMFFSTSGHFVQKEVPVVSSDVDEYVLMMYDMAIKMLS